ncbi:MAG: hypothetical protein H6621_05805 [Halobacteriovoraceae bacterium]|nr:hypothetical protein [Halobacteriovoraceae bacterium]
MDVKCYNCNTLLSFESEFVSRQETCHSCHCDIHCCRMCEFYDPQCYNECRESSADRVTEKEKANFCDYFKLSDGNKNAKNEKEDLIAKANSLFKN